MNRAPDGRVPACVQDADPESRGCPQLDQRWQIFRQPSFPRQVVVVLDDERRRTAKFAMNFEAPVAARDARERLIQTLSESRTPPGCDSRPCDGSPQRIQYPTVDRPAGPSWIGTSRSCRARSRLRCNGDRPRDRNSPQVSDPRRIEATRLRTVAFMSARRGKRGADPERASGRDDQEACYHRAHAQSRQSYQNSSALHRSARCLSARTPNRETTRPERRQAARSPGTGQNSRVLPPTAERRRRPPSAGECSTGRTNAEEI